ncbi:anti-sigma factor domain-containing protein [Clostridium sp. CF012]|uniref:anti-sigma-I factor RsgI family protein n=1 Tax=Clostridium sp. CF012 TaxID=2843319 RepID=UPI001C0ABCEB|nr:anti-sigma factor domain-containing protein [Clostridium sp. CF012]MBU3145676.1 anti-sigma factor domain-containing protein [Clostridium sp. CF012]
MIKTGIVISIINKKAGIMTDRGEFVYVKISKVFPKVGEIHTGELYKKSLFNYKYALTAASLMFIFISSSFAQAYNSPVTTIVISNPSVSLKANRWNKIISFKALNSDGALILSNIKLKNKSIDVGLELLVKEAKDENFINDEHANDNKIISIDIKGSKDNSIDISSFKNIIDSNNLNIIINASSSNNKKIDITVNKKKIDTSTLNRNNNKRESINKNKDIKKDILKKPSVEINTKKIENKSSKNKDNDKTIKSKDNKIKEDGKSENKNSSNNSSTIRRRITSNEIKANFQYNKNFKITNDENSKNSYEIKEKNNTDKRSDNNEHPQRTNNLFNKFIKDFND